MSNRNGQGTPASQEPPVLEPTIRRLGIDMARCQWHQRRTGRQCQKPAQSGRAYCRTHRGNIVQLGPANPNWRHGRWSRLLPVSLRPSSPTEMNHRPVIEIIDGRAEDLLRRIAAGGATWRELSGTYERLIGAMAASDSDVIRTSMIDLRQLATGGAEADKLWAEFDRLMKRRAALVDAERRFALDARNVMTRQQASAHASALVAAIVRHVHDAETLDAIMGDVRKLIEAPAAE